MAAGAADDSKYLELLTSGARVAQELGLRPGIALSAEQVAQLTSDIVWLESQSAIVALPNIGTAVQFHTKRHRAIPTRVA